MLGRNPSLILKEVTEFTWHSLLTFGQTRRNFFLGGKAEVKASEKEKEKLKREGRQ